MIVVWLLSRVTSLVEIAANDDSIDDVVVSVLYETVKFATILPLATPDIRQQASSIRLQTYAFEEDMLNELSVHSANYRLIKKLYIL